MSVCPTVNSSDDWFPGKLLCNHILPFLKVISLCFSSPSPQTHTFWKYQMCKTVFTCQTSCHALHSFIKTSNIKQNQQMEGSGEHVAADFAHVQAACLFWGVFHVTCYPVFLLWLLFVHPCDHQFCPLQVPDSPLQHVLILKLNTAVWLSLLLSFHALAWWGFSCSVGLLYSLCLGQASWFQAVCPWDTLSSSTVPISHLWPFQVLANNSAFW